MELSACLCRAGVPCVLRCFLVVASPAPLRAAKRGFRAQSSRCDAESESRQKAAAAPYYNQVAKRVENKRTQQKTKLRQKECAN